MGRTTYCIPVHRFAWRWSWAGRCCGRLGRLIRFAPVAAAAMALGLGLAEAWGGESPRTPGDCFVYVGTYTGGSSKGIYVCRFAAATGALEPRGLAAASPDPSFLAVSPDHRHLYASNEIEDYAGRRSGSVSAFAIEGGAGKLRPLNVVASGDPGPAHLSLDRSGKWVLVANYRVGSVVVFPVLADGRLGMATAHLAHAGHSINPKRQAGPHAHSVYVSPDNRFALSPDLGTDQVYVYRFDAGRGALEPNRPPFITVAPGTGPRHLGFDPRGRFVYLVQEFGGILTVFSWDAEAGTLHPLETFPAAPRDYAGYNNCAEVFVHPNGKFLYVANRGHDSIGVFAIDPGHGTLTRVEYASTQGKTPRSFALDPSGSYLVAANQESNSVVSFRLDPETGHLTPTGQKLGIRAPACVVFAPAD
jgi:6-phosphogluconolactonase